MYWGKLLGLILAPLATQAATQMPGVFEPPEDTEHPDPSLPPGTIAVELLDADGQPVAHESVTLGILVNSIAKGDSRKHLQSMTDDRGRALFASLETASNVAYRVSSGFQGGSFAAAPFQLEHANAMHVTLHVYPVMHTLQQALIVTELGVAAEVREDRVQLEEVVRIYNLGRTAWQPDNVRMSLPDGFTAFNAQASMSDQRAEEAPGAAILRGTFPPGRHTIDFRWQLPWSGSKDLDFEVGLPPHVAGTRVMMPAAADVKLIVGGLPPAETRRDGQGQKFLVTERRVRPEDQRTVLVIGIHGLPAPGPGRWIATLLAAGGVLAGLAFSFSGRSAAASSDPKKMRSALLEELAELEQARIAGSIGPRTYAQARRELLNALARTFAEREELAL